MSFVTKKIVRKVWNKNLNISYNSVLCHMVNILELNQVWANKNQEYLTAQRFTKHDNNNRMYCFYFFSVAIFFCCCILKQLKSQNDLKNTSSHKLLRLSQTNVEKNTTNTIINPCIKLVHDVLFKFFAMKSLKLFSFRFFVKVSSPLCIGVEWIDVRLDHNNERKLLNFAVAVFRNQSSIIALYTNFPPSGDATQTRKAVTYDYAATKPNGSTVPCNQIQNIMQIYLA